MLQKYKNFILQQLNLEAIVIKTIDKEEGLGWTFDYALEVCNEYRKFLVLCLQNPNIAIVPSTQIDDFWHFHILDTQKYAQDCEQCFGYFLHHFPYFGMRDKQDEKNLKDAWMQTKALYNREFSTMPEYLWLSSKRCPNCGKRIENNDSFMEKRPSFSDYHNDKSINA